MGTDTPIPRTVVERKQQKTVGRCVGGGDVSLSMAWKLWERTLEDWQMVAVNKALHGVVSSSDIEQKCTTVVCKNIYTYIYIYI